MLPLSSQGWGSFSCVCLVKVSRDEQLGDAGWDRRII